jgi:hypothetical protein
MPGHRAKSPLPVLLALAIGVAACDDDPAAPQGPFEISGQWSFTALLSGMQCEASVDLVQNDNTFTGTFTPRRSCSSPFGNFRNPIWGSISEGTIGEGTINAAQVEFSFDDCVYRGAIRDAAAKHMSGTIFCPLSSANPQLRQVGSWESRR